MTLTINVCACVNKKLKEEKEKRDCEYYLYLPQTTNIMFGVLGNSNSERSPESKQNLYFRGTKFSEICNL